MPTEDLVPSAVDVVGNDLVLPPGKIKGVVAGTALDEGVNREQLDAEAYARAVADQDETLAREAGDDALASGIGGLYTRQINTGAGLTGGGDLSADRTLTVVFGTVAGTVAAGNDPRFAGGGTGGGVPPERTLGFLGPAFTGAGDLSADRLIAPVFGDQAGTFCEGNDPRLAGLGGGIVFGDQAGEVCEGNDPRVVAAVPNTRLVSAGTGLTGGGNLSADRTLAVAYGAAPGTAAEGNDARLSNARTPTAHAASHAGGGLDAIAVATTSVAGLLSGPDKTKLDALPATSVPTTRTLTAGTGLTGGGDLSANRTFACSFGTATGTVCQGDDTRVVNAVQTSRQVIAGTGLTGGGTLAADRTLTVSFGATATTVCVGNDARLVGAVQSTRQVIAGTGLTGGGALSADVTLTCSFGTAAGTVCQGNDTRVVNAVQTSRQVIAGTGLTGGGDLTADRTLTVSYGAVANTAAQGNDPRFAANAAAIAAETTARIIGDDAITIVVRAATVVALPAYTGAGTGVLTASANGAFPAIDGVAIPVGSRILVHHAASAVDNWIYSLTADPGAGGQWVLTKEPNLTLANIQGSKVRVVRGNRLCGATFTYKNRKTPTAATRIFWHNDNPTPNWGRKSFLDFACAATVAAVNTAAYASDLTSVTAVGAGSLMGIGPTVTAPMTTIPVNTGPTQGILSGATGSTAVGFYGCMNGWPASPSQPDGGGAHSVATPDIGFTYEYRAAAGTVLSNSVNEYCLAIGFVKQRNTGQKVPADCVGFFYDRTTAPAGGGVGTNWRVIASTAGVATGTDFDTGAAVVAGQFERFELHKDIGDTDLVMSLNGIVVATFTANIPTDFLGMVAFVTKSVGTTTLAALMLDWHGAEYQTPLGRAA